MRMRHRDTLDGVPWWACRDWVAYVRGQRLIDTLWTCTAILKIDVIMISLVFIIDCRMYCEPWRCSPCDILFIDVVMVLQWCFYYNGHISIDNVMWYLLYQYGNSLYQFNIWCEMRNFSWHTSFVILPWSVNVFHAPENRNSKLTPRINDQSPNERNILDTVL